MILETFFRLLLTRSDVILVIEGIIPNLIKINFIWFARAEEDVYPLSPRHQPINSSFCFSVGNSKIHAGIFLLNDL